MMNQISNFLVDFLFYTMIEGFIFYFIYFTYKNFHVSSLICTISDALKFSVLYSFILCVFSRIFPFGFYQVVFILLFPIVLKFYFSENIFDSFVVFFFNICFVVITEFIFILFSNYIFGFNILSYPTESFVRVFVFLLFKIFELFIVFVWRWLRMKLAIGAVTRR